MSTAIAIPELDLTPCGAVRVECVVNGAFENNTYFVISDAEALVIDPATDGEKLAQTFLEEHPDITITGIVCTHGHGDHVGGVAGMRKVLGPQVPFILGAREKDFVRDAVESMRQRFGLAIVMPPVPDRLVSQGDTITFGSAHLQVIDTPGHTPGGIVLFCPAAEGPLAFVGDTLFPGRCGRTDLPGGDQATIVASLGRLFKVLPDETLCLIGHDETTTAAIELKTNPFVQQGLALLK